MATMRLCAAVDLNTIKIPISTRRRFSEELEILMNSFFLFDLSRNCGSCQLNRNTYISVELEMIKAAK